MSSARSLCVWFTGLPASGKSTLANALAARLQADGRRVCVLDGDRLRAGLCSDLGFGDADRQENIRRASEVARLMADAGLIVLVAFISPFGADRALARSKFAAGEFMEVFVDTPLTECERRDPKGLYARARRGELPKLTGVDGRYEAPEAPELRLEAGRLPAAHCVEQVHALINRMMSGG